MLYIGAIMITNKRGQKIIIHHHFPTNLPSIIVYTKQRVDRKGHEIDQKIGGGFHDIGLNFINNMNLKFSQQSPVSLWQSLLFL